MEKAHKAGFINLIGHPNVGKSTLTNALVGERLNIITPKAQTTRHRIFGILNGETPTHDYQLVFSDTPGVLDPAYALQESMLSAVKSAFEDADIFLYVVELGEGPLKHEGFFKGLQETEQPVLVLLNKVDLHDQERLEREYNLDLITTAPSVVYHVHMRDGTMSELHNPADMPDLTLVDHIEEPRIKATILVPDEYLGEVLKLCQDRRGIQNDLTYAGSRAMAVYDLPLNEVVFDFYDRLKSVTKGYASFDYALTGYREDQLVKMSVLVNDEPVDALSMMVHRDRAETRGRAMVEKLKDLIPRHMFKIPIQAAIGGKVIARETLSAMRKDVTAKCYGGDASRKRKLLDKQKAGKKKMRQFGKVDIPQEAFISALKMDS